MEISYASCSPDMYCNNGAFLSFALPRELLIFTMWLRICMYLCMQLSPSQFKQTSAFSDRDFFENNKRTGLFQNCTGKKAWRGITQSFYYISKDFEKCVNAGPCMYVYIRGFLTSAESFEQFWARSENTLCKMEVYVGKREINNHVVFLNLYIKRISRKLIINHTGK